MSQLKVLEICGQVNPEEHIQREFSKQIEKQNIENQIATDPRSTSILKQEDMINEELILKNHEWTEDYITIPKESKLEKSQGSDQKSK